MKVTLIPGDGIGIEIMQATKEVIDHLNLGIEWDIVEAGEKAIKKSGKPLPAEVIESIKKNKIALKGPVTTPIGKGFKSVNVTLRQELNLFANIRPIKSFDGIKSKYENVDLWIVRENTEDLYSGVEHRVGDDAAESIKIITRKASERISKFAFDLAKKESRSKVTAVHKANIMKLSDGLFLESFKKIAKDTSIISEDVIIDAMCMKLVLNPNQFDVIVAPNLYGDILSDLCAGLVGGLGMAAGANIGKDYAVFEPVHGSAPDIAGKQIANPTAGILSACMMLKYIGFYKEAIKVENVLKILFKEKKECTIDLGGNLSTCEFAKAIIKRL